MTERTAATTARQGRHRRRREGPGSIPSGKKSVKKNRGNSNEEPSKEFEEESGEESGEESEEESEEEGNEGREVTMLRKIWTSGAGEVYYDKLRVGGETYSCGECAMMDTESGRRYPAEILFVFKDKFGDDWLETRWLYTKEEIQDRLPRGKWPSMEDAEVFETSEVDSTPAGAIAHKVFVRSEDDYRWNVQRGTLHEYNDLFCRSFFDIRLKRFMISGIQEAALRLKRGRRFSHRSAPTEGASGSSDDDSSSSDDDGDDDDDDDGGDGKVVVMGSADEEEHKGQRPSKRRRSSVVEKEVEMPRDKRKSAGKGKKGKAVERSTSKGKTKSKDKLSRAMDCLHVTAKPKSLPCRTQERDTLLNFLKSNIKSGGLGNVLFVAGMPGTGKTATAHEVVGILRDQQMQGELPSFNLVELNGMRLIKPHQAYTQLWMSLTGEMVPPKRALSKLERYFSSSDPSRDFVVLIVDELDYMTTKKQTVLYNLFEWPSRPLSRLVVVGIANTMDLPERCMPRVSSRLTSRLTFPPYQRKQLIEIVQGRLAELNSGDGDSIGNDKGDTIHSGAIQMAAAKVAASSGDMRTCLKYCCRAIEVRKAKVEAAKAEGRGDKVESVVTIDDVHLAVQEITQQAHLLAVKEAAPQEKLLLIAICNEVHHGGKFTVEMANVRERMRAICRAHPNGPRMPNVATTLEMLSRLGDGQVLSLNLSRRTPLPDVMLNMTAREVVQMLGDDDFSRKVLPRALTDVVPRSS